MKDPRQRPGERAGKEGWEPRPKPHVSLDRQTRWLTSDLPHDRRLFETNPSAITGPWSKALSGLALALLAASVVVGAIDAQWLSVAAVVLAFILQVLAVFLLPGAIIIAAVNGSSVVAGLVAGGLVAMLASRVVGARHARDIGYRV